MAEVIPEIVQIPVAGSDNFSYLVICPNTNKAMGVDPGISPESLLQVVRERDLTLEILANTHGHSDHVAGNAEIIKATGAKLAASPIDVQNPDIPLGTVRGSRTRRTVNPRDNAQTTGRRWVLLDHHDGRDGSGPARHHARSHATRVPEDDAWIR